MIPAIRNLVGPGYFAMHDDTQVARVIEMAKSLKNGQFPVRWVGDLGYGYGYPIYNFYGPLPYYVGGLLTVFGVPAVIATKLMFAIGAIFPSITLFFVLSNLVGLPTALIAATAVLYAPYHAVQIYVRGAVGEYWVIGFWPLILYAFFAKWDAVEKNLAIGGLGVAGAVISHTLMGYVTVVLIGIALIIRGIGLSMRRSFQTLLYEMTIPVLGLFLSAFFWLPAFVEKRYTNINSQIWDPYTNHFVCPSQLWSTLWQYGGSVPGCSDGLSFMLGKVEIICAIFGIGVLLYMKKKPYVMFASLGLALIGIFFTLSWSAPVWKILPQFEYIQFPWRFLAVALFGLAILAGNVPFAFRERFRMPISIVVSIMIVMFSIKWFVPEYGFNPEPGQYESMSDIRWRVSKISDEYLPPALHAPETIDGIVSDTIASTSGLSVSVVRETETEGTYVIASDTDTTVPVNRAYFPGFVYRINGREVHPAIRNGIPIISIQAGQTVLQTKLTDTPVRVAGNILSLIALVTVVFLLYGRKRKTKR